jgi:hypothetical protein
MHVVYFNFSASFCVTFLSGDIATPVSHVISFLFLYLAYLPHLLHLHVPFDSVAVYYYYYYYTLLTGTAFTGNKF